MGEIVNMATAMPMSRSETGERIIDTFTKSSPANYGAWADQSDFKPEVRKACEAQKQSSKNVKYEFSSNFNRRSSKVIIIGQPGVGKTSLVLRYCRDIFERNYKTTIGVDFEVEKYRILGVPFHMQIWDTAGAERFRGVTTAYFRGAHVILLAFDLTNDESLYKTNEWLREAKEYCDTDFDVFLVACKRDMVSDTLYESKKKEALRLADQYNAEYWQTSSRTGENVEELFTRIAIMAFENIMMKEVKTASLPSNGQIATTSTLIKIRAQPDPTKKKKKTKDCCAR